MSESSTFDSGVGYSKNVADGRITSVRLGSRIRLSGEKIVQLMFRLPHFLPENYSAEAVENLLLAGLKNMGTGSLDYYKLDGDYPNFTLAWVDETSFGDKSTFSTKGTQEGAMRIVSVVEELTPPLGYEKAWQITAELNCDLYNGEKVEATLRNGKLVTTLVYKSLN